VRLVLAVLGIFAAAAPVGAATLIVQIQGVDAGRGEIRLALCDRSFDAAGCTRAATRAAAAAVEEFVFDGLVPGRYAVAAYQDLNGNGELDRSLLGLPVEPYGFTNDVGRSERPTIEPALVEVDQGRTVAVVRIRPFGQSQ
jgi:uncharacterized protein (DUF2141 family)